MMFITAVYNEESHCVRLIEDLCKLKWPRDRLLIQVRKVWSILPIVPTPPLTIPTCSSGRR